MNAVLMKENCLISLIRVSFHAVWTLLSIYPIKHNTCHYRWSGRISDTFCRWFHDNPTKYIATSFVGERSSCVVAYRVYQDQTIHLLCYYCCKSTHFGWQVITRPKNICLRYICSSFCKQKKQFLKSMHVLNPNHQSSGQRNLTSCQNVGRRS